MAGNEASRFPLPSRAPERGLSGSGIRCGGGGFFPAALFLPVLFLLLVIGLSAGCGGKGDSGGFGGPGGAAASSKAPAVLEVWFHSGRAAERKTIEDQVARFNAANKGIRVNLTILPEGAYNAQVQAAALAGDLPDLLEFDGPFLYNYVWQGRLAPLDGLLPKGLVEDLLPSIVAQGAYAGRLYSVGVFDSGLGLFGNRRLLEAVGARIPLSVGGAWKAEEFEEILAALAARDDDGAVLDLKLNYQGEWFTYAFSPVIESAGGDLIDRRTMKSAAGVLDGPASAAALTRVQSWIAKGYVDPNIDDSAFTMGRVALSWAGHWEYRRYAKSLGADLVLMPLPDFGRGSRTGQGSWNWGVTAKCRRPGAAAAFLEFLLRPEEVLAMANANGAVPATRTAIARSELYGEKGPLRLFVEQIEAGAAVPRPRTPAYPVITSAFQEAFAAIRNKGDVKAALHRAAAAIDEDIRDNEGYRRK